MEFDFEQADEEARIRAVLEEGIPPGTKLGGAFHLHRRFKPQLMTPEEKADRRARRRKTTGAISKETKERVETIVSPSAREQAQAVMEKMEAFEAKRKNHRLSKLHAELEEIRNMLGRLGALIPEEARRSKTPWSARMYHAESRETYADHFAGLFHMYLQEILPMIASGEAKTGKEAVDMQTQRILDATAEARRVLEERKKNIAL